VIKEVEGMRKDVVMTYLTSYPGVCHKGLSEMTTTL